MLVCWLTMEMYPQNRFMVVCIVLRAPMVIQPFFHYTVYQLVMVCSLRANAQLGCIPEKISAALSKIDRKKVRFGQDSQRSSSAH